MMLGTTKKGFSGIHIFKRSFEINGGN